MAVSVPAWKAALTPSTATWPPKRIVRERVSSTGWDMPPLDTGCRLGQAKRRPNTRRVCDLRWVIANARPNLLLHTDRERHVLGGDGRHQIQDVVVLGVLLDAEVIHVLQRLMVLLAEGHGTLGRVEGEVLHGRDQLLGVG